MAGIEGMKEMKGMKAPYREDGVQLISSSRILKRERRMGGGGEFLEWMAEICHLLRRNSTHHCLGKSLRQKTLVGVAPGKEVVYEDVRH